VGIFFPNIIYLLNYHFTHREKSIIRPYDRWVILCTVKNLFFIIHMMKNFELKMRTLLVLSLPFSHPFVQNWCTELFVLLIFTSICTEFMFAVCLEGFCRLSCIRIEICPLHHMCCQISLSKWLLSKLASKSSSSDSWKEAWENKGSQKFAELSFALNLFFLIIFALNLCLWSGCLTSFEAEVAYCANLNCRIPRSHRSFKKIIILPSWALQDAIIIYWSVNLIMLLHRKNPH
jgi:hypothetical protein